MSPIPQSYEQITAEWLSEVLQTDVQTIELADEHHGTTGRLVINPGYAQGSAGPASLFIKLPPPDPQQRQFVTSTGMGKRETLFYRQLSHEVAVRVPRCYYAGCDDSGEHYIMLLENLELSGCSFRNASKHYSLDYVKSVMDGFAGLHGAYMNSPRFDTDLSWIQPPMSHPMGPKLVKRAYDHYGEQMPDIFGEAARLYLDNADAIHALWCLGAPTVVHGDVHDGNLFTDNGRAGFLDWAIVCRTSGMRDVANFLVGSARPDDREQYQQQWLAEYRQGLLLAAGADAPSEEALWREYQWHALYCWVAAATTVAMGSEWQPINYTTKTLQRVHRALENLDSLDSIRSALNG